MNGQLARGSDNREQTVLSEVLEASARAPRLRAVILAGRQGHPD
jgi:hypothetical protein